MNKYTIKITSGDLKKNEMPFIAYCKEWDFFAENKTIPEVLSSLFDMIRILEEEKEKKNPPKKSKLTLTKDINFQIPATA
ncbi:hypothetical protein K9M41_00040 [Candidatus Gracilibacteria bacterium]|nr:hypothetical protein [Candidatus Gracilibacteria bacterium]